MTTRKLLLGTVAALLMLATPAMADKKDAAGAYAGLVTYELYCKPLTAVQAAMRDFAAAQLNATEKAEVLAEYREVIEKYPPLWCTLMAPNVDKIGK